MYTHTHTHTYTLLTHTQMAGRKKPTIKAPTTAPTESSDSAPAKEASHTPSEKTAQKPPENVLPKGANTGSNPATDNQPAVENKSVAHSESVKATSARSDAVKAALFADDDDDDLFDSPTMPLTKSDGAKSIFD